MTTTLREQLDSRLVRYRLGKVFVQTIEKPFTRTVQLDDGRFGEMKSEGLYLARVGDGTGTNLSDGFDPSVPEQAEAIRKYDQWLEQNKMTAFRNGIEKIGVKRPAARIPNWDNMDLGQLENVVEAVKPDLLWAMEYELLRDPEIGGPREDVVNLLEEIYAHGFMSSIEESDMVPTL